jgi:hypothetical protein
MKIDISVKKSENGYFATSDFDGNRICSGPAMSFLMSIVLFGDNAHAILDIDILSPDHELTIKLSHEN